MKEKIKKKFHTSNMIKLIIGIIFGALILFNPIQNVYASTLSCFNVNGMAIFGYKYGEWKFIGAIANEFDSDSIANEFGAGNEFSSDSIFNEFGTFGSEFSSYSAFNEFASKPPIIVNNNYKFIGYLTINDFKTPNINTYEAITCAKNSFKSFSDSDLKDIIFKNIPSNNYTGSVGYSQQEMEDFLKSICSANSTYINGQCLCNEGYLMRNNKCITYTQGCQLTYGPNSYGDKQYCYCSTGYEWNTSKTDCIKNAVCPLNSSNINNVCVCNEGYLMRNNTCITYTQDCINSFGEHTYGLKGKDDNSDCYCVSGYQWNSSNTICVLLATQALIPSTTTIPPTITIPPTTTILSTTTSLPSTEKALTETTITIVQSFDKRAIENTGQAGSFLQILLFSIKEFFSGFFKR